MPLSFGMSRTFSSDNLNNNIDTHISDDDSINDIDTDTDTDNDNTNDNDTDTDNDNDNDNDTDNDDESINNNDTDNDNNDNNDDNDDDDDDNDNDINININNDTDTDNDIIINDAKKSFDLYYTDLRNIDKHFNKKYRKLNQSKSILELKYKRYKWCNDIWNISIIFTSSFLTLVESSKLVFLDLNDNYEKDNLMQNFFVFSPIFLGTTITGISSYIKFKKYQDIMEHIYILIDKCIGMLAKLKNKLDEVDLLNNIAKQYIKSELYNNRKFLNDFIKDVKNIHKSYEKDIIKEFLVVYQETEKFINFKDYDKYLHKIHKTDYKRHVLYKDRELFYKKYITDSDINNNYFDNIKNDSRNNKNNIKTRCF